MPALYSYLLFFKYGPQIRLLRALELRIANIEESAITTMSLHTATKASSPATSDDHGRRRSSAGIRETLNEVVPRRLSNPRNAAGRRHSTDSTELPPIANEEIEKLKQESQRIHDALPDYVKKLVDGYEMRWAGRLGRGICLTVSLTNHAFDPRLDSAYAFEIFE